MPGQRFGHDLQKRLGRREVQQPDANEAKADRDS